MDPTGMNMTGLRPVATHLTITTPSTLPLPLPILSRTTSGALREMLLKWRASEWEKMTGARVRELWPVSAVTATGDRHSQIWRMAVRLSGCCGLAPTYRACRAVLSETWLISMRIPRRFISLMSSLPRGLVYQRTNLPPEEVEYARQTTPLLFYLGENTSRIGKGVVARVGERHVAHA